MTVRTETAEFMSQHVDGVGTLADLRNDYGPTSPLSPHETEDDGRPTEKTLERYRTLERINASMGLAGERGAVWTVYEETQDSNLTKQGRVYVRNSLALYAYGDRTKILGWIVSTKGSGPYYRNYLVGRGENV